MQLLTLVMRKLKFIIKPKYRRFCRFHTRTLTIPLHQAPKSLSNYTNPHFFDQVISANFVTISPVRSILYKHPKSSHLKLDISVCTILINIVWQTLFSLFFFFTILFVLFSLSRIAVFTKQSQKKTMFRSWLLQYHDYHFDITTELD